MKGEDESFDLATLFMGKWLKFCARILHDEIHSRWLEPASNSLYEIIQAVEKSRSPIPLWRKHQLHG
ncbi:hypothetical protein N9942_02535, partial [Akkermansiaceae bacterium]|nr:hypothetical protein [Akkermansiaceae bacterium]